jgi:hypothetical protein
MYPSTETLKEKTRLRLKARKELRLVCKNWYKCLSWNDLFLKNDFTLENGVFLKICCFDEISVKQQSQRFESEINDKQLLQDESLLPVTILFTPERLKEFTGTLFPTFLIIEHGFQLPLSQINLQGVCKLMVIAKDEVASAKNEMASHRYDMTEQLEKLLESIDSESLKILVLGHMSITDREWLLLYSRFSKLEYLGLPNCTIDDPDIYWEKFSSIKTLTLTLQDLCLHDNIVLHLNTKTGRWLTFDHRMRNVM